MPPDSLTWEALTRLAWIGYPTVVVRETSRGVPCSVAEGRDSDVGPDSDLRTRSSRGIACARSGDSSRYRTANESHLERFASRRASREDVAHGRAESSDASEVVLRVLVQLIASVGKRAYTNRNSAWEADCGQASDGVGSTPSDKRARAKTGAKRCNLNPERITLGELCRPSTQELKCLQSQVVEQFDLDTNMGILISQAL